MGDSGADSTEEELESLQQRFLCHHPLTDVSFTKLFTPHGENSSEIQKKFLLSTLKHPAAEKYPLPRAYRRDFLKAAIVELEGMSMEVLPEIYELYLSLCSYDPDEDFAYKSYKLATENGLEWVHIKESRSIAADGSTGVHSWPAGVALANWCLQNKDELRGKVVLELGSGVGLTGMTVIKACKPRTYVFSDYHPQVFKKIRENLVLNNLVSFVDKNDENGDDDDMDLKDGASSPVHAIGDIRVMRLDWRYKGLLPSNIDYVIGSDLIFEPALIAPLIETIGRLLEMNGEKCRALIAVTERNPDTVAKFEAEVDSHVPPLSREVISYESQKPLLWAARHETVKLYSISKAVV